MTHENTPGDQLRPTLIAILYRRGLPMTTTQLRESATELSNAPHPIVAEQIYRSLLVLQRRGLVRRVYVKPSPNAHWLLTRVGAARAVIADGEVAQAQ